MILSFDVECRGLYGQTFAVGFDLTTNAGRSIYSGIHCCPFSDVDCEESKSYNDAWIEENVLPHIPSPNCFTAFGVREKFMAEVLSISRMAAKQGEDFLFLADVPYPCEARFLMECWRDDPGKHGPLMPYPLLDLSSILLAKGYNPVYTFARRDNELPAHNPLCDARQASRIYHQLMRGEPIE